MRTDLFSEFCALSRTIWPHLNHVSAKLLHSENMASSIEESSSLHVQVNDNQVVQLYESLLPLPEASGRASYVEFKLLHSSQPLSESVSLVLGVALPGVVCASLGRTKASAALDLTRSLLYDGLQGGMTQNQIGISVGDVVGVGLCYECHGDERGIDCMLVTRNGQVLTQVRTLPALHRRQYLASIFCNGTSTTWSLNRGGSLPFMFEIGKWQRQHAEQDLFRMYLSADPMAPTSTDLSNDTWSDARLAEYFAYADHYIPIHRALQTCPDSDFLFTMAALQFKLLQWMRIRYRLFQTANDDAETPWSIPPEYSTQAGLDAFLQSNGFPTFQLDFTLESPMLAQRLLKNLTMLRTDVQVRMLELAAERYGRRESVYDDLEESRGGALEGWIKFALFLHGTLHLPTNPWLTFIREKALDLQLEMGISMDEVAEGFFHEEPVNEQAVDGNSQESQEELKANMAIAIGMTVMAWASYTGALTKNVATRLLQQKGHVVPPDTEPLHKDHSLSLLAFAILNAQDQWTPTMGWILMQYEAFGFCCSAPQLNILPSQFDSAVASVKAYFAQLVSELTEVDYEAPLQDIVHLGKGDFAGGDLEYLAHVWTLATGISTSPSPIFIRNLIASHIPEHLLQRAGLSREQAEPPSPPAAPPEAPPRHRQLPALPPSVGSTSASQASASAHNKQHENQSTESPSSTRKAEPWSTATIAVVASAALLASAAFGAFLATAILYRPGRQQSKK